MSAWSIYGLVDPAAGSIRYVGYTSQIPEKRLKEHLYLARKKGDKRYRLPVFRWIRSLLAVGQLPEIRVLEIGAGDWKEAERRHIKVMRDAGHELTNVADGGLGPICVSKAARRRAGLKLKNRYFSPDHRRRISEAKRGRPRPDSAEIARRMAENNRGRKMTFSAAGLEARRENGRRVAALGNWTKLAPPERLAEWSVSQAEKTKEVWALRGGEERARIAAAISASMRRFSAEEQRAKKTARQRIRRAICAR